MEEQGVETGGAAHAAPPTGQSGLDLIALTKVFPGGTVAVDDVNLHVDHGEYVVLLGPSGCGKTTTLRMIGGHEYPTQGEILLDGVSLIDLPPHKRPTTTVFQHFALFPHRTTLQNVEFGLKMHGVGKEERREQSMKALEMVGLEPLADRKPSALSGGQQQRVALARVLVTKPQALLLDEPLGDLDRLLQLRMRVELRNLQRQLGLMFIHVTHNQEEALSMADRIVVMNDARIQQVADPLTIATKPATEVVARFMGDNNIVRGVVTGREGDRLVVENEQHVRSSVHAPGAGHDGREPGDDRHPGRSGDRRAGWLGRRRQLGGMRDRLRRVPRRPRQAPPPDGRLRADARQGRRGALPHPAGPGGGADQDLLEGRGCPAPRRLSGRETTPPGWRSTTSRRSRPSSSSGGRRPRRRSAKVAERGRGSGWVTAALAAPGLLWIGFYLVAPLVIIVLVSFWTWTDAGFDKTFTTANYSELFHDRTYWDNMLSTVVTSVIAVVACLVLGFPVAYFLALKVQSLRIQIALFIIALAPFWTSFLTRAIAWTFPLMGREGALNQFLVKLGIVSEPIPELGFSTLSVRLAMIQLYILFMVTPLFFTLAQVDRSALEAARDLGANWWGTFREVILPQTMPGIVIGSIFIFVLTMGDYGTVATVGGGNITSVGTLIYSKIGAVQYPQGAASAVLLVAVLMIGVWVITRLSNLREDL